MNKNRELPPFKVAEVKEVIYSPVSKREILEEGVYQGVSYAILNLGTHPTAYVENIVNATDMYDGKIIDIDVHFGFTYVGENYWNEVDKRWYLGWDYSHCDDFMGYYTPADGPLFQLKRWTLDEIRDEVLYVIRQLLKEKEGLKK